MMGTKTALEPASLGNLPGGYLATHWIPRAVRCRHCGSLAREEVRERMSDDEIVVRYECGSCRHHQTRHYFDSQLGHNG